VKDAMKRYASIFNSLAGTPLTDEQKEAILRNDNRVLAVAGAGTGKTTTVVGKVQFLLRRNWCRPEEILLLSFSRGAVGELKSRVAAICRGEIQVRTFHSLGLEIITKATKRKPAIFQQSERNLTETVLTFLEDMMEHPQARKHLLSFLAYHYFPSRGAQEFDTKQGYLRYLSSNNIRTLKNELVKSNQETQIANWLYLNGIEYIYEAEYKEAKTGSEEKRVYTPDFYLPNDGVYIEHFGIDRNGNTAKWIDGHSYRASMEWKRKLHRKYQTRLVETYSYQGFEGTLISDLRSGLAEVGVSIQPIPVEEILASKMIRERLRPTARLLSTVLTLFKSEHSSLSDFSHRIERNGSGKRPIVFFKVFKDVYRRYEALLREKGEVDFGDMIIEAARHVESGRYHSPFKVVVVDEFQDISRGRAWLMNALLEQVDDARLLCVGDDWQSIYRFTGSDVGLMTDYETQWPQAARVDLGRSFRFNDQIQRLSSAFIMQNPAQLKKVIECETVWPGPGPAVHVVTKGLAEILTEIGSKAPEASVLVLGRYNQTVSRSAAEIARDTGTTVQCKTVHKAKGLEADYVIVDQVQSGKFGFPSEIDDDPIVSLFLAEAAPHPNAEERRLFYVALTRARREVWLRVSHKHPSSFIEKMLRQDEYRGLVSCEEDALVDRRKCPECDGVLVVRENHAQQVFLGCVYFPRCKGKLPGCPQCGKTIPRQIDATFRCPSPACGWEAEACPLCGVGFAVERRSQYGAFLGCSMYGYTGCRWKSRRKSG